MKFKLAQCLCPKRHCIMALLGDGEDEPIRTGLEQQIDKQIKKKALHPWCALCGAKHETWQVEIGTLKAKDINEALSELLHLQYEQQQTRDYLMATGLAYDSPRRN